MGGVCPDHDALVLSTVCRKASNHLGSASVITDTNGNIEDQTDYFPYGGVAYSSGADSNHYKFTGKERDTESGLDNFEARYYGSTLGRFMTPDWAARPTAVPYAVFGDPQSLNLYGYVRNDPVSRADADGHDPLVPMGPLEDDSGTTYNEERAQTLTGKEEKQEKNATQTQTQQTQQDQKKDTAPSSNNDSSKKPDPSTVTVVAGAGLAPQASGAANAAKDQAKNFMKSAKPDPPLRGAPSETPNVTKLSPKRQLLKDAIDTLGDILGGAASGSTEILIIAPVPQIIITRPDQMPDAPYHGPV
jgi:RHS repeat-associated protein